MNVIDSFLQRYAKEYDYYHQLARLVGSMCESLLQKNGIRAIVTYRAKKPYSLREKLNKRNLIKKYQSIDQIYKDIVDLAGVRIAIYFPGDRDEIGRLIESDFITEKVKKFPNNDQKSHIYDSFRRRFTGYDALHYRVSIKEEQLDESQKRYAETKVEIQIASAMMHAWAEVEHDLIYKPKIGSLSEEEFKIMDELNGLVLQGENALEKLQKAFKNRVVNMEVPFNNHYELAALIREKLSGSVETDIPMGRVDILMRFLQKIRKDTPSNLELYLQCFKSSTEQKTISDRMVDLVLADNPEFYKEYMEAKAETVSYSPYIPFKEKTFVLREHKALAEFMAGWIELQRCLGVTAPAGESQFVGLCRMAQGLEDVSDFLTELNYLYSLRNSVIFVDELPKAIELENAAAAVERLMKLIGR